jgi:hypothetical protein
VYPHVPSVAAGRYQKAFLKHDPMGYAEYKAKLVTGEAKINASVAYPYDVIRSLNHGDRAVAIEQWKALPNYLEGSDENILPIVDVSGSMTSPIGGKYVAGKAQTSRLDVAVSLGLYCADKNTGPFKDLFLTFSTSPKFEHLKGTLTQKIRQMERSHWDMSTNLHGAFTEILRVATSNKVAPEDMPKVLLIMSDMQFNSCMRHDDSAIQMIRRKYEDAGYEVPAVVFWNLNAADNVPVKFDEKGTALVSGFSPAIMKAVLGADLEGFTPESFMIKAVSSDRYAL